MYARNVDKTLRQEKIPFCAAHDRAPLAPKLTIHTKNCTIINGN